MAAASEKHDNVTTAVSGERRQRPRWTLSNIAEYRVFGAGIRRLHQDLKSRLASDETMTCLMSFPKRKSGAPMLMQASFFSRLLDGRLEIKGCLESDVSAAQMDLRHLTCEQLLELRARNVDFMTASGSHSAHLNFLSVLDSHLFEKLAQKLLMRADTPSQSVEIRRAMGRKVLLTMGAMQMLEDGWGTSSIPTGSWPMRALPPTVWLWDLGVDGGRLAVFNAVELWIYAPCSSHEEKLTLQDLHRAARGGEVSMLCDSTSGIGRARSLMWDITAMDPSRDDIIGAIVAAHGAASAQLSLAYEVAAAAAAVQTSKAAQLGRARVSAILNVPRPLRTRPLDLEALMPATAAPAAASANAEHIAGATDCVSVTFTSGAAQTSSQAAPEPEPMLQGATDPEASQDADQFQAAPAGSTAQHKPRPAFHEPHVESQAQVLEPNQESRCGAASSGKFLRTNGWVAPQMSARGTRRCPRASVAFLAGRVAGAIARIETDAGAAGGA